MKPIRFISIKRVLFFSLSGAFILATPSCTNKWKEKTNVPFKFSMTQGNGPVTFTSATITFNQITFSGQRQEGGNVSFTNTQPTLISFENCAGSSGLNFDIPQGTYTSIQMGFDSPNGSTPQIEVHGTYTNHHPPVTVTPFIFQFSPGQHFPTVVKNVSGGDQIVLVAGHSSTATVTVDANSWFGIITPGLLDNATQDTINGVPTIMLNPNRNNGIYNQVSNRLGASFQITFN